MTAKSIYAAIISPYAVPTCCSLCSSWSLICSPNQSHLKLQAILPRKKGTLLFLLLINSPYSYRSELEAEQTGSTAPSLDVHPATMCRPQHCHMTKRVFPEPGPRLRWLAPLQIQVKHFSPNLPGCLAQFSTNGPSPLLLLLWCNPGVRKPRHSY